PLADDQRPGVIDLETTPSVQFHCEHTVRLKPPQPVEDLFKALCSHSRISGERVFSGQVPVFIIVLEIRGVAVKLLSLREPDVANGLVARPFGISIACRSNHDPMYNPGPLQENRE